MRISNFPWKQCKQNIFYLYGDYQIEQQKRHWHWETAAQHGLLEPCLGQRTGSTYQLPGWFLRLLFLKPQHKAANFISLLLYSMYLFWPADLAEKYTLSAPLPSLQNKPGKMLYSDPSHPGSHSAGILGAKTKPFPGGHTAGRCCQQPTSKLQDLLQQGKTCQRKGRV